MTDYTNSLPNDCLAQIFNFLTTDDRNNSSLVSHRWLQIDAQTRTRLTLDAQSNIQQFIPSIFTRFNSLTELALFNRNFAPVSINDNDLNLITSMCPNLRHIELNTCRQLTDSGLAVLSNNCKKLKVFHCAYCRFSDLGIFEFLDNSSQLEELFVGNLYNYPYVKPPRNFRAGAAAKSLKDIELNNVNNERIFEPLITASKNLTTLTLSSGGSWDRSLEMIPNDSCLEEVVLQDVNVSDVGLISVAKNCWALKTLWVRDVKAIVKIGDEGLVAVGKHSLNLQELFLEGVYVSDAGLISVAKNCRALKRLSIRFVLIGDEGLIAVGNHSVNLEELSLIEVNVTNVGLVSVAKNCRALKRLSIGSVEIGDEGLIAVGNHSVNLQELSLDGVDATCLSLDVIATNCQNLVRLTLCRSDTITDAEMQCIADKCTALKSLRIEFCHGLSDKGIEAFASGCPNLKNIEVVESDKVTRNVKDWMRDSGVQEHVE